MVNWKKIFLILYAQGEREYRPTSMGCSQSIISVGFINNGTGKHQSNTVHNTFGVSRCLDANDYKHPELIIGNEE